MKKIIYTFFSFFLAFQLTAQTTVVDIVVNSPDHNTLEAAVIAADLAGTLSGPGPFTVFAPTDAAFSALPDGTIDALLADPQGALTDILTYHVLGADVRSTDLVDGQMATTINGKDITVTINANGVFINDAQVTVADVVADNGVVHVIDAVLIPPTNTIVDVIVNSPSHTILETAVVAAGLTDALSAEGPFTVFAPTDSAFMNLPAGLLDRLIENPGGALTRVLVNHVVAGQALSTDLTNGQTITSILGEDLQVTINQFGVFINGALVEVADIVADNGVVHVIDAVLVPNGNINTIMDIVATSPDHTVLQTALETAGLNNTLNGSDNFTLFAPTDAAFGMIPDEVIQAILADQDALTAILLYHVTPGPTQAASLQDGQMIMTVNGADITVTIDNGNVFINNAQVTVTDLAASNGIVHVIDAVLLPPGVTVMDVIATSDQHTILEAAIDAAGLTETLRGEGPFTVFAPTDDAFQALPAGTIDALLADPQGLLTDILLYHVLAADVRSTDLMDGQMATTINGKDVTVRLENGNVFINDAQVLLADIETDNGVVHVIDAVLIPPTVTVVDVVVNSPDHTILEAAVLAADLAETLSGDGPFTVFAPTDAAFQALPAGTIDALLADPSGALTDILLYHVLAADVRSTDLVDGQMATTINGKDVTVTINANGVFINDAQVTVADIVTDNGVVHVIDAVLIPPTVTVVDVVVNSPDHTILEAAVIAADLAGTLSGEGPFTVFAPTDAAFQALPAGTIDALLADPSGALTDILLYHVLAADVRSTDLVDGQMATTINGKDVTVTINANGVFINDAQVTVADIVTDNGVVHVIDAVLIPPTVTVVDVVVNSPDHTILEAAVIAADLAGTLSGEGPFTVFAPTDAAFQALPAGTIDALLADPAGALTDILLYHVLAADVRSTDLVDGQMATTINGKDITVTINANGVFINDAQVTVADIVTDNGVVHVIDAVLIPPTRTVVDVVVESPDHTILEAAVIAADLAGTLSGEGPFTVFAPTDAAFQALPAGTIDALLADPSGQLTDILLYHVVGATALSTDLSNGQMVTTLNGQDITVTINANGVFINDAQVTVADIVTDNGVVHVIDAVLLPTSSVNDVDNFDNINIYPNPASDFITLDFDVDGNQNMNIQLFNTEGRLMSEWRNQAATTTLSLDNVEAGWYIMKITLDKEVYSKRVCVFR